MMNDKVSSVCFKRDGSKWVKTYEDNDRDSVYRTLADLLIKRYIEKASYCSRVQRVQLYNGFIRLTVYFDGGVVKQVFTVENNPF